MLGQLYGRCASHQTTGGTFFFFAPEMTKVKHGAGFSGKAADLWALGVSLYMWLYFAPPFEAPSMTELLEVSQR